MAKHHTPEEKRARRAKKAQEWDARESYAKGLMQGILSMLEPGDVVIDCGANLGAVSGPLADTGATVLVTLNALRLLGFDPTKEA